MDKLIRMLYGIVLIFSIAFAFYYTTSCADGTSYVADKYTQFDDRIALVEVNSILHPGDAKHLFFYTISGSTLFYGRVMMWADALVSFIPDKIWGVEGQVVATRLTHFFVLLLALHLLITFFIKDKLLQLIVLAFSVVSPYFIYFSFVPKPEPFVLFFLTLFLRGFIKSEWKFGKHFFWLGLALGCKISVLPLIPVFFVLPIFYSEQKFQFIFKIMNILKSGLWLVCGFLVCIPCLILTPVKPVFLQTYLYQSIGSASKEYDDPTINFFTWGQHLFHNHYSIYPPLLMIFAALVFFAAIYFLVKDKKISQENLLFGVGLIQIFLIFFMTKRIWPHYLFVGLTFSIIAAASLFESMFYTKLKLISVLFFALFIPQSISFAKDANKLHEREYLNEFIRVKENGKQAFEYLKSKNVHFIAFDLSTYVPNSTVVKGQHFEPFPSQKKASDLRIEGINEYGDLLYTKGFEAIVFEKNCPCDSANRGNKVYFMKDAFSSFAKFVPAAYHLDTTFSTTRIFLKNEIVQ